MRRQFSGAPQWQPMPTTVMLSLCVLDVPAGSGTWAYQPRPPLHTLRAFRLLVRAMCQLRRISVGGRMRRSGKWSRSPRGEARLSDRIRLHNARKQARIGASGVFFDGGAAFIGLARIRHIRLCGKSMRRWYRFAPNFEVYPTESCQLSSGRLLGLRVRFLANYAEQPRDCALLMWPRVHTHRRLLQTKWDGLGDCGGWRPPRASALPFPQGKRGTVSHRYSSRSSVKQMEQRIASNPLPLAAGMRLMP